MLQKTLKDACKVSSEVLHGLMSQTIKDRLFNFNPDDGTLARTAEAQAKLQTN